MTQSLLNSDSKPVDGRARSLANLRPFERGVSGNPAGRPKSIGRTIVEHLNDMAEWPKDRIEAIAAEGSSPASALIASRLLLDAMNGDHRAIEELCDRTMGKAIQTNVNIAETTHVRRTVIHVPAGSALKN